MKNNTSVTKKRDILKENAKGYPPYSPDDDIYVMDEKENLDPDEMGKDARVSGKVIMPENNILQNNNIGGGLDIPGAELDDADEETGNEDEENNYYSLGGDNHMDLEEDKG